VGRAKNSASKEFKEFKNGLSGSNVCSRAVGVQQRLAVLVVLAMRLATQNAIANTVAVLFEILELLVLLGLLELLLLLRLLGG
jgi:hypothetical protein